MFSYQQFAESKPKLLIAVILTTVAALSVPVLMPHIYHGAHIWHLLLHTSGIILSVFLAILSVNAYYKMRTKKMIITTIAIMGNICGGNSNGVRHVLWRIQSNQNIGR